MRRRKTEEAAEPIVGPIRRFLRARDDRAVRAEEELERERLRRRYDANVGRLSGEIAGLKAHIDAAAKAKPRASEKRRKRRSASLQAAELPESSEPGDGDQPSSPRKGGEP